ncbi:MAG: response regulator [Phototrophicales bacterium]|nr:response regulator [Phototrophicales bacterium]
MMMDTISTYTILVVEDNEPINRLFCRHLSAFGYSCSGVTNVEDALKQIHANPPHLLILDFELPDGYGTRVLDDIQTHRLNIPTIVVSASPRAFALKHTNYDIDHILVKPISPSTLSELVQRTLINGIG